MGKPTQATIEINGKRYDARTGQLITAGHSSSHQTAKPKPKIPSTHSPAKSHPVQDIARLAAAPAKRRQTARSQTLMRHGVKKPAVVPQTKPAKARAAADIAPVRSSNTVPRIQHFDAARQTRAQTIKQSRLVSKFHNSEVLQHPIATTQAAVTERIEHLPVRPAPAIKHAASQAQSVLERGLKNAQSHTETFKPEQKHAKKSKKRGKSKVASYAAGTLAAVLLFGFIAYQSVPNMSVRYAAARSGVNASLPGYQPSGFALSNRIQYNPGQITINFSSTTDDRAFSITQRETAWNSDALKTNYVDDQSDKVQKYEDRGRTIYLYGDNNATWVNGGVWYDINGNSQLNSDQLIRIATSM